MSFDRIRVGHGMSGQKYDPKKEKDEGQTFIGKEHEAYRSRKIRMWIWIRNTSILTID